jgi:hypothetical protein
MPPCRLFTATISLDYRGRGAMANENIRLIDGFHYFKRQAK